jgi:RimJ/RimL family protein N-acetyltransferase
VLHGERVSLRGRREEDVAVFTAELFEDVETFSRAASGAWRPLAIGEASPYSNREPSERTAPFSVVDRKSGELLGVANLWGIDAHNRFAHVGVSLRPTARGHGYGTDTVLVLCDYAFRVLGLHRLGLETLADNEAMVTVAQRCGFVLEGRARESAWISGGFVDEVSFGLLATDWARRDGRTA